MIKLPSSERIPHEGGGTDSAVAAVKLNPIALLPALSGAPNTSSRSAESHFWPPPSATPFSRRASSGSLPPSWTAVGTSGRFVVALRATEERALPCRVPAGMETLPAHTAGPYCRATLPMCFASRRGKRSGPVLRLAGRGLLRHSSPSGRDARCAREGEEGRAPRDETSGSGSEAGRARRASPETMRVSTSPACGRARLCFPALLLRPFSPSWRPFRPGALARMGLCGETCHPFRGPSGPRSGRWVPRPCRLEGGREPAGARRKGHPRLRLGGGRVLPEGREGGNTVGHGEEGGAPRVQKGAWVPAIPERHRCHTRWRTRADGPSRKGLC